MIFLFFAFLAFAAPTASDRIQIKEVFGAKEVRVLINNKENIRYVGDELFLGNVIETKPKQIVLLESFDKSQWKVAPETTLKLEKRLAEKKTLSYWVFGLVKGYLWGKVTPNTDKEGYRLKIKTKSAAIGIRGTEYLLAGNDNSELDVLEGTVWWGKSENFEPNSYVEVKAGEHAEMVNGEIVKPAATTLKGDDLLLKYRLVLSKDDLDKAEKENERSPEDCRAMGQGWKSKAGTNRGECYRASPKDAEDQRILTLILQVERGFFLSQMRLQVKVSVSPS